MRLRLTRLNVHVLILTMTSLLPCQCCNQQRQRRKNRITLPPRLQSRIQVMLQVSCAILFRPNVLVPLLPVNLPKLLSSAKLSVVQVEPCQQTARFNHAQKDQRTLKQSITEEALCVPYTTHSSSVNRVLFMFMKDVSCPAPMATRFLVSNGRVKGVHSIPPVSN
jgi:hypothetical protein